MLRLCFATALIVIAGCGAKVVLEEEGSGGSGGSSETSSASSAKTGSTKSTGTAASCADLEQSFLDAVAAAAACSPTMSSLQCTTIVDDTCGCPTIALNTKLRPLVNEAKLAYDAWVDEGCGPIPCTQCIPAGIGYCQPSPDGGTGTCVADVQF